MTRPSQVKIGPHTYKILWSKESWKKYATEKERESNLGMTKWISNTILIRGWDMAESQQRDTLLHELIHACFGLYGYADLPLTMTSLSDQEEIVIRLLTPALLSLFRDNPVVVEYLLEKE